MPQPIPVELVPHSPAWADAARAEAERIRHALPTSLLVVHHIGSTAVPGISAKPILDLLPVARSLEALDAERPRLVALGYQWWGEYGIAGRRYCTLHDAATARRRCQLHCFEDAHPQVEWLLAFRDYLRAHPVAARAYDEEKQRCRRLHPLDDHSYADAKAAWIKACLVHALEYRSRAGRPQPR
jgi:GrpB-like predicted nucleotidyltransferase (UPF0157 family)